MRIHEFVDEGLGHSSYLIDLGDGTSATVDPPRFPIDHEALAGQLGLRLAWTLDTHSHADYVTGSPGLARRSGAVFIAPAAARLASPHQAVHDGEHITLAAGVDLVALATPGHTPDHHAYLVTERGTPVGLFTGGSLMVGAVGRTDLCGPALARPLAHEMFHSLHRFDNLPDDVPVYPTHGAGSFCSAPGSSQRSTTLHRERTTNPLFSLADEDEFVEQLLAGFGTFPSYFARLPELNRLGPRRYDTLPQLSRLTPAGVERFVSNGGALVDVRPTADFAAGYVSGSISNTLRPVYASWLGWLIEADRPIAFILNANQNLDDVVRHSLDVGHEHLVGELAGGFDAWASSGRPVNTIPLVAPDAVSAHVVDVRQANEYTTGHLPGAVNAELGSIASVDLPDGPLTLMCGHGERAMSAASLLAAQGRRALTVFDGGPDTWSATTGRSLERGQ